LRRAEEAMLSVDLTSDLIGRARGGDAAALARLIDLCQPDVRRYARRHCSNAADVEDAIQEVNIVLMRHLSGLRAAGAFLGWLNVTMLRMCLHLGRRFSGRYSEISDIADDLRFSTTPSPELRRDIAAAIAAPPPLYREVVVLRDFEELSMKEIAARLAIEVSAVKVRLHRAREMLREYLTA
jgi:RNA polymerase sigma factor (sigma-70 family)